MRLPSGEYLQYAKTEQFFFFFGGQVVTRLYFFTPGGRDDLIDGDACCASCADLRVTPSGVVRDAVDFSLFANVKRGFRPGDQ